MTAYKLTKTTVENPPFPDPGKRRLRKVTAQSWNRDYTVSHALYAWALEHGHCPPIGWATSGSLSEMRLMCGSPLEAHQISRVAKSTD